MPKDLTKMSLKEFDLVSDGEDQQAFQWRNGTLEMRVYGVDDRAAEDDD